MVEVSRPSTIEKWFQHWDESMLWSYFQQVMGTAYIDQEDCPSAAIVHVNDFAFAAGKPDVQLIADWYRHCVKGFAIITARDAAWHPAFETVGGDHCRCVERYAIKKEPGCFDKSCLSAYVAQLDPHYEIRPIDKALYHECKQAPWSKDFVSGFESFEDFQCKGLGFVALLDGKPVAGASSYSAYRGGIEVEVDTFEPHRRKGLATACAARLILSCLEKGLYPSWDAQNRWSVALAEKLGYHFSHAYPAYEFWK